MKRINNILYFGLALLALSSCANKLEYKEVPMVALDFKSKTVNESAEGTRLAIPVHLYNSGAACSVTYTVDALTATEGVDYKIVDNSGVLNFAAGTDSLAIAVDIFGQPGEYTGNLQFRVSLQSAPEGVTVSPVSSCLVTIADLDHPLSAILGEYVADGTDAYGRAHQWPVKITADEKDLTKVWIDCIIGFIDYNDVYDWGNWSCYGVVSEDLKTITIPYLQKTDIEWAADNDFLYLCSWGVDGGQPVIDDAPGDIKLVWNDQYGGFINDARITYGAALTGKIGNYYTLYYAANSILFTKE